MYFAFSIKDVPDESIIPTGWYPAKIIRCDMRSLKSGEGNRLVMTYVIDSGPYKTRKIDVGFNVDHPNPKAVEISQKELAKVLRACGVEQITDTLELHDRVHQIHIGIETYNDREQNRINDWKPLGPVAVASVASPVRSVANPSSPAATAKARNGASAEFQAPRPMNAPPAAPFVAPPARPAPRQAAPVAQAVAAAAATAAAPAEEALPFNDDIPF
jgi:hypothetical protein